jgi:hypothetical protein
MLLGDVTDALPAIAPVYSVQQQLLGDGSTPKVKKFMHNIYSEEFYSVSALREYIDSFYSGYKFEDYQFSGECKANMTNFLDTFHTFS